MDEEELKATHDELLAKMPEGSHEAETCVFCNDTFNSENDQPTERGDMKNYTEDEFNAAVSAALAPIQAELEELKASQALEEVNVLVAQAKDEADTRVAEIQAELDAALGEAAVAKQELTDALSFLQAEADAAAEAELFESRKEERLAEIAKVAKFDQKTLDENIDRWASKSDEDFADLLAGWATAKATSASTETSGSIDLIPETSMSSTRTEGAGASTFSDLLGARRKGINLSNL